MDGDGPTLDLQFAGDDPREVEEVVDEPGLQHHVPLDDLDGVSSPIAVELP
jgi:hypothetical protein